MSIAPGLIAAVFIGLTPTRTGAVDAVARPPLLPGLPEDLPNAALGAFSELWREALAPVLSPVMQLLAREGEWLMLVGFSACWLWSIAAMLKSRSAEAKSAGFNHVCLLSYIGGLVYLIQRLGPGWSGELVFWLYLLNIVLTMIDLKLILEYQLRARLSPARSPSGLRAGAAISPPAVGLQAIDYRTEAFADPQFDEGATFADREALWARIDALERDLANIRRSDDMPEEADAEPGFNIFLTDEEEASSPPPGAQVQPDPEIVIKKLAEITPDETVHARAWKAIRPNALAEVAPAPPIGRAR